MRAARLVHLLLLLQNLGPCTASRLADELEVSVRTIYRDIEALAAAGVPVYAERGPGGGIRLLDGYQTRLTGLTDAEAGSLGLIGVPAAASQLGLGAVVAAAQAKLDAALPPELRARSQRLRERFLVDLPGWFDRPTDPEALAHLPALSEALWRGTRVEVRYRRGGPPSLPAARHTVRRRIGPLGLVLKAGRWYLLAEAGRGRTGASRAPDAAGPRPDVRVYRVERVVAVRSLDEPVRRPAGFDLGSEWRRSQADFERSMLRGMVRLRIDADAVHRLRAAVIDAAWQAADASARPDPVDDRRLIIDLPVESIEVAHDELLRLAPVVEVLEPIELRAALARTAGLLAERYGTGAAQGPRL
ncbi:MAG: WYL domain-containing protein [Acidimicrobiales bacterium]